MPALEEFLGGTARPSPETVTRLTKQWSDGHAAFQDWALSDRDYVYVWADGIHPKVRLGRAHSCVLVLLGVRLDGTKEPALTTVFRGVWRKFREPTTPCSC